MANINAKGGYRYCSKYASNDRVTRRTAKLW